VSNLLILDQRVGEKGSAGGCLSDICVPDIIDGNMKLTLGMIWTLILRFTIADIRFTHIFLPVSMFITHLSFSVRKVCLPKRASYSGVSARQSHTKKLMCGISLPVGRMGLPCLFFLCSLRMSHPHCLLRRCALIHCHRPDLLDYDKLDKVRVVNAQITSLLLVYNRRNATRILALHFK
jgi:hypothetical protein